MRSRLVASGGNVVCVYTAEQEPALIVFLFGRIDLVCQSEVFLRLVSYGAPFRRNGLRRSHS